MPVGKYPNYQAVDYNSLLDKSIIWNNFPHYGKLPIINV